MPRAKTYHEIVEIIPGYVTTAEAARITGMDPASIRHLVHKQLVEGKHLAPRLLVVRLASLEAYEKKKQPRGAPRGARKK